MKNNLMNKKSGIVHILDGPNNAHTLCNNIPMIEIKTGQFLPSTVAFLETTDEQATCKTCLRVLEVSRKG